MTVRGLLQVLLGGVFQADERVVGAGQRPEQLVEFALGGGVGLAWVCGMTNTMAKVSAATKVWKIVSSRVGKSRTTLNTTHNASAATMMSAMGGRAAHRSTPCRS